jgi:heavy metal translocating P-type ATPase
MFSERMLRRLLVTVAVVGLAAGLLARLAGRADLAGAAWTAATVPVIAALAFYIARDLFAGRMGVDAIALVAMAGALALHQPLAGAVVAIMYAGGNVLEDLAVTRAEKSLRALVDRAPRVAHRRTATGVEDVPVADITIGDAILVRAGEVVPVDGVIAAEPAVIDESPLTGEPIPVTRRQGASVYSGAINAGQAFAMNATARAGDSTYAGIVRLVSAAQTAKAPFVRLADRFALIFLPLTAAVAFVAWALSGDPVRSLAVFVAATPCPLILAAPVAFIAGVAQAARRGVLIKGGAALEGLARARTVLFDKTGTLTLGGARLLSIEAAPGIQVDDVLQLGASLEQASHHVLAEVIVKAAVERGLTLKMPRDVRETVGAGLHGVIDGKRVSAGSRALVPADVDTEGWALRAARRAAWRSALIVFVAVEDRLIGALLLADELRPETPRAIRLLRDAGIARIVMVTGDRAATAETIGASLDLDAVLAERVPSDKLDAVQSERRINPTIMVGDGINDAPALAAADVGIALGARGASASSEAADVVVLADRLDRVAETIRIARRAHDIAIESIVAGMGLSGLAMLAAAIGWLAPVPAAVIQEAIDLAVILNALRALRPVHTRTGRTIPPETGAALHHDHVALLRSLDRLRAIADALDDATPENAAPLIVEANDLVRQHVVAHEREDETGVYPKLAKILAEGVGLSAMSRAHREILHLARLLERLAADLPSEAIDRYLIRDAQHIIESIEQIVRVHTAQEEDIYDAVAAS